MKRTLVALLSSVLLVTAYGPATSSSPPAAGAAPTDTPNEQAAQTMIVWTRNYTVRDDAPSPFFSARDKLEAANPNVKVELSGVAYDPQYNRLQLSQAGAISDRPDVFLMDPVWMGQFVEDGLLANLDTYYASWTGASDIIDAYVESTKVNGSQYGVWAWGDIRLFIWNKDVFRAAGLDPEKGPATWQDVMDDAAAIKAKVPGVTPVGFPAAAQESTVDRFYPYLYMTGSNVLSADGKTPRFNDAGGQKAVQFLVDLVDKGYASQDVLIQDAELVVAGVLAGKYGMMLATVGDAFGARPEGMTSDEFRSKIGAIVPPICDGCTQATNVGGWMLGINASSDKKDLAWQYILDVTDGANMVPFQAYFVRTPVRESGLQPDAFKDDPYFAESVKANEFAQFPPFVPRYLEMIEPIWTAIQVAIQGTPVKEALDQAAADVEGILAE